MITTCTVSGLRLGQVMLIPKENCFEAVRVTAIVPRGFHDQQSMWEVTGQAFSGNFHTVVIPWTAFVLVSEQL